MKAGNKGSEGVGKELEGKEWESQLNGNSAFVFPLASTCHCSASASVVFPVLLGIFLKYVKIIFETFPPCLFIALGMCMCMYVIYVCV